MNRLLLCLALAASIGTVRAQTENRPTISRSEWLNGLTGSYVTVSIQFPGIDGSEFNDRLQAAQLPQADMPMQLPGFGLHEVFQRHVIAYSYQRLIRNHGEPGYATDTKLRTHSIHYGYEVFGGKVCAVYPYAGFQFVRFEYLYHGNAPNNGTVNGYLAGRTDYRRIGLDRSNLDVGLGVSFYRKTSLFNLRGGYLLPLHHPKWQTEINGTELNDGPALPCQYYVTLTFGYGDVTLTTRNRKGHTPKPAPVL